MLLHALIILADVPVSLQNFLLFANRRFLVQINRDGSGTQAFTLSPDTTNAIAIDFDIRLRYMFWTDVAHHEILAARLDGSQFVKMVTTSITTPGMQLALLN